MGRAGGGFSVSNTYKKNIEKIGVPVDKLSEFATATVASVIGMGAFIVRKLYFRIEKIETQVDEINRNLLTREDLVQIQDTQKVILQSLLDHRATEKNDVHK